MDKTKHGLKHIPFWLRIRAFIREKIRGEEEKERREEEKKKRRRRRMKKGRREEEVFNVWILVKELYGICV